MKKILLFVIMVIGTLGISTSCRMAPRQELGDTVAASEYDIWSDTASTHLAARKKAKAAALVKDSSDIFVIGEGSTTDRLQLLSYPSRRDTFLYHKARHVKVSGSAEIGNIAKITFYVLASGDSLVSKVAQFNPKNQASVR